MSIIDKLKNELQQNAQGSFNLMGYNGGINRAIEIVQEHEWIAEAEAYKERVAVKPEKECLSVEPVKCACEIR